MLALRKSEGEICAWTKPTRDHAKLNVDATYDPDSLQGVVGAVMRDHNGKFTVAANEKIEFCFDAFRAEALTLRPHLVAGDPPGIPVLSLGGNNPNKFRPSFLKGLFGPKRERCFCP